MRPTPTTRFAGLAATPAPHRTAPAERRCRVCGCTDDHACFPPCWWVEFDLCSACPAPETVADLRTTQDRMRGLGAPE